MPAKKTTTRKTKKKVDEEGDEDVKPVEHVPSEVVFDPDAVPADFAAVQPTTLDPEPKREVLSLTEAEVDDVIGRLVKASKERELEKKIEINMNDPQAFIGQRVRLKSNNQIGWVVNAVGTSLKIEGMSKPGMTWRDLNYSVNFRDVQLAPEEES